MEVVSSGSFTDALTLSFTMRSDISGAQFAAMSEIDIGFDAFIVDLDSFDTDPESAGR